MVGRKKKHEINANDTCRSLALPLHCQCDMCQARLLTCCTKPWEKEHFYQNEENFFMVWDFLIQNNFKVSKDYSNFRIKVDKREEKQESDFLLHEKDKNKGKDERAYASVNVNNIIFPEKRESITNVAGFGRHLDFDQDTSPLQSMSTNVSISPPQEPRPSIIDPMEGGVTIARTPLETTKRLESSRKRKGWLEGSPLDFSKTFQQLNAKLRVDEVRQMLMTPLKRRTEMSSNVQSQTRGVKEKIMDTAILSAAKSRVDRAISSVRVSLHIDTPQFPSYHKYQIPTNLYGEMEAIEIGGVIRDTVLLHKEAQKELKFNFKNGRPGYLLQVPQSSDLASFNVRAKDWVFRMLNRINPTDQSVAVNHLCTWLSSKFPEEFAKVAEKLQLVRIEKMTEEEATAVWSEANVPYEKAKIILKHLRSKYGVSFQVPFSKLRALGALTVERRYGEHEYIAEIGDKPETIKYWYMNFCDLIAADMERILNTQGLKKYGYKRGEQTVPGIDVVIGSDHGQGASRFVVKFNLLPSSSRKESGKIQTGSRQHSFGKIKCKKEKEEFVNLISPHLRGMCRKIKNHKLVAIEVPSSEDDGDAALKTKRYKCMLVPLEEQDSGWITIIPRFYLYICGDLAFYAMAMGRDSCSGSRCPYCDLKYSEFCDPSKELVNKGDPLTYQRLLDFAQRLLDEDNELDTGGLKCQPMFEEEMCQYIVPILHLLLGLTNKVHNELIDFLDDKIQILIGEELSKRVELESSSKEYQRLDTAIKQKEEQKKTISSNKKFFTDQIKGNTNYITVLREESENNDLSFEQKEAYKPLMKQLREVNKSLREQSKVLLEQMKPLTASINNLVPQRRKLRDSITVLNKYCKEARKKRKSKADGIEYKVDNILNPFQIKPAAYHGGDFIGNDCLRYMTNAEEIFQKIRESCEIMRQESNRCTQQELDTKLNEYYRVIRAMDLTFKELRNPAPTEDEMSNMEKIIKMLEMYWRKAGLSITIKAHILFEHTMPQVRRLDGIADLVEDFVEKAHQEGKGLEDMTKRMSAGFEAQEEVQIKRQWAASNPEVQTTKEDVTEGARRKRKRASSLSEAEAQKQQKRAAYQETLLDGHDIFF